jgi:very-short-patch-repair endonuclease
MSKRLTQDEIIERFRNIHGDRYDYSLVVYTDIFTKVKIICKEHGIFEQTPHNHCIRNCPKCSSIKKNNEIFIKKSKEIHGDDTFDYSLVNYINNEINVKLICHKHGIFNIIPFNHICGNCNGCPKCKKEKMTLCFKDNFIKKSKKIHGEDKYDYSLVNYVNNYTKVKIICKVHGIFEQIPIYHSSGYGCPMCKESNGERLIRIFLQENNIKYVKQQRFKNCKYKQQLRFDFFLPDYNLCIEFDGQQHFKKFSFEKNDNELNERIKRDNIKNEYCKNNNIHLLRIKYNENVFNKLKIYFKI